MNMPAQYDAIGDVVVLSHDCIHSSAFALNLARAQIG